MGCKGEEKQKEEDTLTGEKIKLMATKEDVGFACCLVCWLPCEEQKQHETKERQKLSRELVVGLQSVELHRCKL